MITKDILMRIDLEKVAKIKGNKTCFLDNIEKCQKFQLSLFN